MDAGRKAEPDELLTRFPEAAEVADVVCVRFRAMSSTAIGPSDWLALDGGGARRRRARGAARRHRHHARHRDPGRDRVLPEPHAQGRRDRRPGRVATPGHGPQLGRGAQPPERRARRGSARGAWARRARPAQRRDSGRPRSDQGLDAPRWRPSGARTSACSATRIRTVASPSTDGRHDVTHRGRSSTCAAAPSCRAWTSRRRTRGPTAPPSRPSSPPAPAPSSRRRCRPA